MEASSIFIFEAMAMCKPVVATSACELFEIIDGENGVLADAKNLGEEIASLLFDERGLKEIGKNARKYAINNHNREKIAE